jgi:cleavage stimulation factor subunit 3
MRELYPDDPSLDQFAHRYAIPTFDPTSVRHILSPSQTRPKTMGGYPTEMQGSPAPRYMDASLNSPKRPYPSDEFDDDNRPRKFARAESPMKGGQARRLDQPKRVQQLNGQTTSYKPQGSPTPLPREVVTLLSIIPPAHAYNISRLSPEKMIDLLRHVDIPATTAQIPLPQNSHGTGAGQNPSGAMNPYSGKLIVELVPFIV